MSVYNSPEEDGYPSPRGATQPQQVRITAVCPSCQRMGFLKEVGENELICTACWCSGDAEVAWEFMRANGLVPETRSDRVERACDKAWENNRG